MSSKRCRIRFRSGDLISAVDDVTCDDEASVANKTKPGNESVGVAVFVRLTGNTPQKSAANITLMKAAYRKGEQRIHPGLESCKRHREVLLEA